MVCRELPCVVERNERMHIPTIGIHYSRTDSPEGELDSCTHNHITISVFLHDPYKIEMAHVRAGTPRSHDSPDKGFDISPTQQANLRRDRVMKSSLGVLPGTKKKIKIINLMRLLSSGYCSTQHLVSLGSYVKRRFAVMGFDDRIFDIYQFQVAASRRNT